MLAYWLKRCARRGFWRWEESRFSAHRNQGNCASSSAMASAAVCPGAALWLTSGLIGYSPYWKTGRRKK
jgi:hypothetical protein